jgi:tRNA threonylcarbamoyladenosine biosynthesis protein TsaE
VVLYSRSASETIRIGRLLGKRLLPGDVIALIGELGTGKTQFIKGLVWGTGVSRPSRVSSPSFTLIQKYDAKIPFYHIDLYRLRSEKEAEELGLEEVLGREGIAAIEWADRIPSFLPEEILQITLQYIGENKRSIEITARGKRYIDLLKDLGNSPHPHPLPQRARE